MSLYVCMILCVCMCLCVFMCLCICMCVYICVYMCLCVLACMYRSEINVGCLFQSVWILKSCFIYWGGVSHLTLELSTLASLPSQIVGESGYSGFHAGITCRPLPTPSIWVLGIQTRVFMCAWKVLYLLSHLSSPKENILLILDSGWAQNSTFHFKSRIWNTTVLRFKYFLCISC